MGNLGYIRVRDEVCPGADWNSKKRRGFVTYSWAVPGSKEAVPKISYQVYDEDWDWIISAGAYEIDFNSGAGHIRNILI